MFAALADGDDSDDDFDNMLGGDWDRAMGACTVHLRHARRFLRRNTPFRQDLIINESRMGRSTASYFTFFRWLFINNLLLFVIQSVFLGFHLSVLLTSGHQPLRIGFEDTMNVMTMSSTERVLPENIQWFDLEGGIPRWVSFSSYSTDEALAYSGILVLSFLLLLALTAFKWIAEDKTNKLSAALKVAVVGALV